jgi:hypothetical protein
LTDPIKLAIEIIEQLIACHDEPTCPAITVGREALAALRSIKPDCRNCVHRNYTKGYCMTTIQCVDFDKFQALPLVNLTKETK